MEFRLRQLRQSLGFSLVEVMAAAVVFIIGATASLRILSSSLNSTQHSLEIEEIVTIATTALEKQRSSLVPSSETETVGDYTLITTVSGCTFASATLTCASTCSATVPVCKISVTVTHRLTNDSETLTTMKLTEHL